jgi:hypothetical protein
MSSNLASSKHAFSQPSMTNTIITEKRDSNYGGLCEKKLFEQIDEGLNVPLAPSQTFTSICSSMLIEE